MKLIELSGFKDYMSSLKVTRGINKIQLHHTYSPSYEQFKGNNHKDLQKAMKNFHIKSNGWSDIGQHFTIFPDGKICAGRSINSAPAGIKGANTGAICIECLGNFDKGGDEMTAAQRNAIVKVVKVLLDRFGIDAKTGVVYHAWWKADGSALGTYVAGKSAKTCPGTNFFGGNTKDAFEKNLLPLIENYGKDNALTKTEEISTIVHKLSEAGALADDELWKQKCKDDINIYWLCKKIAEKTGKDNIESIDEIISILKDKGILSNSELWIKKCNEDKDVYWLCRKTANELKGIL